MSRRTIAVVVSAVIVVVLLYLAHTFNLLGLARSIHGG
jgi:hypothetical protein